MAADAVQYKFCDSGISVYIQHVSCDKTRNHIRHSHGDSDVTDYWWRIFVDVARENQTEKGA